MIRHCLFVSIAVIHGVGRSEAVIDPKGLETLAPNGGVAFRGNANEFFGRIARVCLFSEQDPRGQEFSHVIVLSRFFAAASMWHSQGLPMIRVMIAYLIINSISKLPRSAKSIYQENTT